MVGYHQKIQRCIYLYPGTIERMDNRQTLGPSVSGIRISGLVFVLLAYLLGAGIRRLKKPVAVTISLIIILAVCLGVAFNPVYISGGHGSSYQFSLLGFPDILGQFRIPSVVSLSYFICLTLLIVVLLVYQHRPQSFPTLPLSREQRRRQAAGTSQLNATSLR